MHNEKRGSYSFKVPLKLTFPSMRTRFSDRTETNKLGKYYFAFNQREDLNNGNDNESLFVDTLSSQLLSMRVTGLILNL